jgi:YfiH family protein
MKLFNYLGDNEHPYRTIMANHSNFFIDNFMIPKNRIVITEQTHSRNIHICSDIDCGAGFDDHPQIHDCDGMVTNLPHQFLLIRTADCTPVLFYDKNTQSIGSVHSGREGTRKNIVKNLIQTMQVEYMSLPENIQVWIGAGICKEHYEVSEKIAQEFNQTCLQNNLLLDETDCRYIDIQNVIIKQLVQSGILLKNIHRNKICTYESLAHFSYRRDGTRNRQINVIGLING